VKAKGPDRDPKRREINRQASSLGSKEAEVDAAPVAVVMEIVDLTQRNPHRKEKQCNASSSQASCYSSEKASQKKRGCYRIALDRYCIVQRKQPPFPIKPTCIVGTLASLHNPKETDSSSCHHARPPSHGTTTITIRTWVSISPKGLGGKKSKAPLPTLYTFFFVAERTGGGDP
jgi:hypothetical protein